MAWTGIRKVVIVIFLSYIFNSATGQFSADEKLNIMSDKGIAVLKIGQTQTIYCVSQEPAIKWVDVKGNVVGPRGPKHHVHVEEATGLLMLRFDDPQFSDNGTWTCRAGNMERYLTVFVVEEVQFEPRNLLETPLEGEDLTLTCMAKGVPTPTLSWYRNGVLMTAKYNPEKYDVGEGKLLIRHVSREDSREYECRAQQSLPVWNHTASSVTKVLVRYSPVMKLGSFQKQYVLYDHIRVIRCSASAFPKPQYSWSHLTPRGERFVPAYSGDIYTARNGSFSELTVRVNGQDDLGDYVCYAKNAHGRNKMVFHLIKGIKPNPPVKVVYNTSTSDALLFNVDCGNCTSPANSTDIIPEVGYRFELMQQELKRIYVERDPVYWDEDRDQILCVDAERSQDSLTRVEGLNRNTTYAVRVATLNLAGPSNFVELPEQFTTTAGADRLQAVVAAAYVLLVSYKITEFL